MSEDVKSEVNCKNCGGPIAIRNPTGKCDHLYYPENVPGYVSEREALLRCEEALRAMMGAIDGGAIDSGEIGGNEHDGIPPHKWHEEWAHHTRAALTLLDEARK